MAKKIKTITLGELKQKLSWVLKLDDDTLITLGSGDLSISRPKTRLYKTDTAGNETPEIVNIEFNELYNVTADPDDAA